MLLPWGESHKYVQSVTSSGGEVRRLSKLGRSKEEPEPGIAFRWKMDDKRVCTRNVD